MPWDKNFESGERYELIQTLAQLKAKHPALSRGSMKILYAQCHVLSIARFWEHEAFVSVISTEEKDCTIRLPLGAVGAVKPFGASDIFKRPLSFDYCDEHSVFMQVEAHQSYFFRCDIP